MYKFTRVATDETLVCEGYIRDKERIPEMVTLLRLKEGEVCHVTQEGYTTLSVASYGIVSGVLRMLDTEYAVNTSC